MAYTTIDDPTIYFNTKLYTGNGSTQSITGVGFQPDWIWTKGRSGARGHTLVDVIRGATKTLESATGSAEETHSNSITSIDSDGFSLGNRNQGNANSETFVSWNWKAGGSASNNTDGNTTTSASVNQTAGFSIMKYAGDGNESTIGHGLGAEPEFIIFKEIDGGESWRVWSKYTPDTASKALALNLSSAAFSQTNWIGTISSSIITIGSDSSINTSGNNYIAYAFAPKKGYSKFGSYTGNGSSSGTYVHLGFKPAFLLYKCSSDNFTNWQIHDSARSPSNLSVNRLNPNDSSAELSTTADSFDLLSNGFKARGTASNSNNSGSSFIYMAFAESSFVTSTGIPTTAR